MHFIEITSPPICEGTYEYTPKYVAHVSPPPTRLQKRDTIRGRLSGRPRYFRAGGPVFGISFQPVAEQLRKKARQVGAKSRNCLRARRQP